MADVTPSQVDAGLSHALTPYMSTVNRLSASPSTAPNFGVHAAQPFLTPKYALHTGQRFRYTNTMARMFIQVPPGLYKDFMKSISEKDTEMVWIANALVGDNVKQGGAGYIDFFLQRAHHALNDKYQVSETLTDNFVAFFFGMQAPVFSYTGVLLNTYQDYWAARMLRIFTEMGRGTKLAQRKFVMKLRYDNMIVSGAMVNFEWDLMAENEMACPFNFNLLVTRVDLLFGGLTPPVTMPTGWTFAPESDAHLLGGPEVALGAPKQTVAGAPQPTATNGPQGISEANPVPTAVPYVDEASVMPVTPSVTQQKDSIDANNDELYGRESRQP